MRGIFDIIKQIESGAYKGRFIYGFLLYAFFVWEIRLCRILYRRDRVAPEKSQALVPARPFSKSNLQKGGKYMKFEENKNLTTLPNIKCPIIYFLLDQEEVVYVGQSRLGVCRPFQHTTKIFDSVSVLECKEEELDFLESKFILKYKPKYNHSIINGYSYSYKKIRSLIRNETYLKDFTLNDLKYIVKKLEINTDAFDGVFYVNQDDFKRILKFINDNEKSIKSSYSLRNAFY